MSDQLEQLEKRRYVEQADLLMEVDLNEWDEYEKAAYLASCLRGPALAVLGNLPERNRRNLKSLVSALDN